MRGIVCLALAALAALVAVMWDIREANACGGCFVPPQSRSATQVTGHRMLLSLSNEQTTLYDQIEYAGDPESFAWVLPIHGVVEVGLSSDLVFSALDQLSGVTIQAPAINCPPVGGCPNGSTGFAASAGPSGGSGGAGGGTGVEVLVQETVGPFETVQLATTDPNALTDWLTSHGYAIPSEIQPLIDDYVGEGFNFLAMKLVPGAGVDAMRPVRITTPGASPALPLRMVAAGTGVTTTVSLWILAEGRYQPSNFPWFVITADELVWNWDTQSSNYKTLRQERYDASGGLAWLVESANGLSVGQLQTTILNTAQWYPNESGYDPTNAEQEAEEDLAVLVGTLASGSAWFTRLRAELSRDAFDKDLSLEAAAQDAVATLLSVANTTGTAPSCPPGPDCNGDGIPDGAIGSRAPYQSPSGDDSGCAAAAPEAEIGWAILPLFLIFLVMLRLKRRH